MIYTGAQFLDGLRCLWPGWLGASLQWHYLSVVDRSPLRHIMPLLWNSQEDIFMGTLAPPCILACLHRMTMVLLVSYIYTDAHEFARAPAHTHTIQYDVNMHRFTREHSCVIMHTHIQDLSVPYQTATFVKKDMTLLILWLFIFSMIILEVSLMMFAKWRGKHGPRTKAKCGN